MAPGGERLLKFGALGTWPGTPHPSPASTSPWRHPIPTREDKPLLIAWPGSFQEHPIRFTFALMIFSSVGVVLRIQFHYMRLSLNLS